MSTAGDDPTGAGTPPMPNATGPRLCRGCAHFCAGDDGWGACWFADSPGSNLNQIPADYGGCTYWEARARDDEIGDGEQSAERES